MSAVDETLLAALRLVLAEMREASAPKDIPPAPMTVRDLWALYWRAECHALDSAKTEAGRMRVALEVPIPVNGTPAPGALEVPFGDLRITEVRQDHLMCMRDARKRMVTRYRKPPTPATRNREVTRIKRMFAWACEPRQRLLPMDPVAGTPLEQENNVKRGKIGREDELALLLTFTHAEKGALSETQGALVRAFILPLVDSGLRESECTNLRWDTFEHDTGRISLLALDRKTDDPLTPRLSRRALRAILALPHVPGCPFVFANPKTRRKYHHRWIVELFDAAVLASGIRGPDGEKITPHSLRHSFVYKARRRWKLPERVIMSMTGHKTRSAFERYGIVDQDEVEEGYDKRDAAIESDPDAK